MTPATIIALHSISSHSFVNHKPVNPKLKLTSASLHKALGTNPPTILNNEDFGMGIWGMGQVSLDWLIVM